MKKGEINYNNRTFTSKSNSATGEVSELTTFYYKQEGQALKATYAGGQIRTGQMLGIVNERGELDFVYHHINTDGELRSGRCTSIPEILKDGRMRLHESWQWMDGDLQEGNSIVEEIIGDI